MTIFPFRSRAVAGSMKAGAVAPDRVAAPVEFTMPTPPSVNQLYRNLPGKGRVKTSLYFDYVSLGVTAIRGQKVEPIPGRVVAIVGVERTSLAADLDNRAKAIFDTIVKAGVLKDDSLITAICMVWLPKANGLAWIRLEPVAELFLQFQPSKDGAHGGLFVNRA